MGFDSTSQHLLDKVDRGISADDIEAIFDNLEAVNIMPHINLMLGLPGETLKQAEATCKWLAANFHRIEIDTVQRMVPEPTSLVGNHPEQFGIELMRGDELMHDSDMIYGGGRYGFPRLNAPLLDELISSFLQQYAESRQRLCASTALDHLRRYAGWQHMTIRLRPGTTVMRTFPAARSRLINFVNGRSADIPDAHLDVLDLCVGRHSVVEFCRKMEPDRRNAVFELVRSLYVDGFLELVEPRAERAVVDTGICEGL